MTTIKVDGATITLTPEQLADIDRQRQQPKEPEGLTWEQAFEKVKPKHFDAYMTKLFIDEKHRKSCDALYQLMVIAEAYNMGREKGEEFYNGSYDRSAKLLFSNRHEIIDENPIVFFNRGDLNQSFITNRQLWLDFFMVEDKQ